MNDKKSSPNQNQALAVVGQLEARKYEIIQRWRLWYINDEQTLVQTKRLNQSDRTMYYATTIVHIVNQLKFVYRGSSC